MPKIKLTERQAEILSSLTAGKANASAKQEKKTAKASKKDKKAS
ncbi:MAG: hypothetical protein OXU70_04200 [Gammaproteobacteria bacterium]|nr:hypothetical protein [Gammaproteobacteria bacterium]